MISPKTVKNHISNILMKLQIDNRIQAASYIVRQGLGSETRQTRVVVELRPWHHEEHPETPRITEAQLAGGCELEQHVGVWTPWRPRRLENQLSGHSEMKDENLAAREVELTQTRKNEFYHITLRNVPVYTVVLLQGKN